MMTMSLAVRIEVRDVCIPIDDVIATVLLMMTIPTLIASLAGVMVLLVTK